MTQWNRKQRILAFISGYIGFVGGFQLGILEEPIISLVGTLFMIWGMYYMFKGLSLE